MGRQNENHNHRTLPKLITWITTLWNLMKLWGMPCSVTQDGWGHGGEFWQNMVHWRREWQTTSAFLSWEPHEQYENEKRHDMERWKPRLLGAQYTTREERRNSSWRNEEAESKQKWHPAVDVTGGESKVWWCKEQYCIGTWNARTMNQGKLEVVKQEMARVSIDILGIRELKWTGMGEFNSDDHYIYYCGQKSFQSKGVTLVNNRIWNAVLGCNLKNRMISVHFQSKQFNISVIQVYAPTTNAEEDEVEWFCEDLQHILELAPKKISFSSRGTGMQK